jgi:FAD/FMN-containing dehydrogenase
MTIRQSESHNTLSISAVETLREHFQEQLLLAGDPAYDEARQLFNAMIDKKPALIARCSTTADVIACVHFARQEDLAVAIRGGGHNGAGLALGIYIS